MLLQLINYIAVFIVFCDAFTLQNALPFMELRLSYPLMILVFALCLPFLRGIPFNRTFLFIFGVIIVSSLYNTYVGKDTFFLLTKQVIGIFSNALLFYLLIKVNRYDVKRLFKVYLNFAILTAVIGLFQELNYLLGVRAGYDFSYILVSSLHISPAGFLKITSIMSEPSAFCYVMIPAFFAAIRSFTKSEFKFLNRRTSLMIILSFIFSFSLVGYIGMIFSVMLLFLNYAKVKYFVIGIAVMSILMFFAYINVADLRMRVDDSVGIFTGGKKLEQTNQSTYALFSNALVAWESFKDNPLFGSGLGSHSISYGKYINKVVDVDAVHPGYLFTNSGDASSLFFRLMSETGLLGSVSVFCFIFRFWILKNNDKNNVMWIVNNAILTVFLVRAIRGGHYFAGGTFFFMWLYYFSGKYGIICHDDGQLQQDTNHNLSHI